MPNQNTIRPTDDAARALARRLIDQARFGALAVQEPQTGAPMVTRIAIGTSPEGAPISLISDLSLHTRALRAHPICSLLLGEPLDKGDPLTHPRLTLQCAVQFIEKGGQGYEPLHRHYLETHPKSKLYIDFADFSFAVFSCSKAYLNGGFGKAFELRPQDLRPV